MKFVKRFVQKMSESYDNENESERHQRFASAQAEYHQRARDQFNERYDRSHRPQRPNRQESICKWQKIFSRMLQRSKLKNLPNAGHEKYQPEHEAREQQGPAAVEIGILLKTIHAY